MSNVFERIPTFKWAELGGKTLEIIVSRDSGFITVGGRCKRTGVMYVLYCEAEEDGI